MGILVNVSDFSGGIYDLPQSITDRVDLYINQIEGQFLTDLLGIKLYNLFIADLNAQVPNADRFKAIYNKFLTDPLDSASVYYGKSIRSLGMKDMLKNVIYFEYCRKGKYNVGMSGSVNNNTESSTPAPLTYLFTYYNSSIATYHAIQEYCYYDNNTYPEFAGLYKSVSSPI